MTGINSANSSIVSGHSLLSISAPPSVIKTLSSNLMPVPSNLENTMHAHVSASVIIMD